MKPTRSREEELTDLRNWCLIVIRFIGGMSPQHSDIWSMAEKGIEAGFEKKHLSGLRVAASDLAESTRDLSASDRSRLDKILREECGYGLREQGQAEKARLRRILKRGTIRDADEYRLLTKYADQWYADETKQLEFERINELLHAFDQHALGLGAEVPEEEC